RTAITCSTKCRKSSRNYDARCCDERCCGECTAGWLASLRYIDHSTLLHRLSLNQNFERAADQPARIFDSESEPVDFGYRRAVDDLVTPRRAAAVGHRHIQSDLAALTLDRQRSGNAQHVSVFAASDARALKTNLRMRRGVQKVF